MSEKYRDACSHILLTLFPAIGFLIPLLYMGDMISFLVPSLVLLFLLILFLEMNRQFKKIRLPSAIVITAAAVLWLTLGKGFMQLTDIIRAVYLTVRGTSGALPLVAVPFTVLITILSGALWFLITDSSVSVLDLIIGILELLFLWLSDRSEMLICVLPVFLTFLLLYCSQRNEGMSKKTLLPCLAVIFLIAFIPAVFGGIEIPALKQKADRFRQEVMDRLFFTEPRDVYSLSSEGFYPQGQNQLGGPVYPSDHPVMDVSTPRVTYLRGTVLNEYDGRAWKNTTGGRRYLWELSRWDDVKSALFDQALPGGKLNDGSGLMMTRTVTVRLLTDTASTLFVPQRADSFMSGGDLVLYFNNSSEVFATRNLQTGDTYTVTSRLFTSDDAGLSTLINAAASLRDDRWEEVSSLYTALPDHLEQPVYDLAASITVGYETMYEKAYAIQTWLSRNNRYKLDIALQPVNVDFVTNFLLNTKEGYCTYFASAMTVLCRMAGLPARYVEGYVAHPDENGHAVVTGKNAHAWTEVYFKGFGWVTFDATPGHAQTEQLGNSQDSGNPPPQNAGSDTDSPNADDESEPESTEPPASDDMEPDEPTPTETPQEQDPETDEPDRADPEPANRFPWLLLLLITVLVFLLFLVLRSLPQAMEKRAKTNSARWEIYETAILDLLHIRKIRKTPSQSPAAWFTAIDSTGVFGISIAPVAFTRSLYSYAGKAPDPTDLETARDILNQLLKAQSLPCRLRWCLYRAACSVGMKRTG